MLVPGQEYNGGTLAEPTREKSYGLGPCQRERSRDLRSMPMAALTSFLAMVGCLFDLCFSVPGALQALYSVHPNSRGFADGIMSRLRVNAAQQMVRCRPL